MLAWRGWAPSRLALNVQTGVLMRVYLLTTAGLDAFRAANQQLPAFDVHYLFVYASLLLVWVHLIFNLPLPAPPPALALAPAIGTALCRAGTAAPVTGARVRPAKHQRNYQSFR